MKKMVFIYTRVYDSEKMDYKEERRYELGLADASGSLKDAATGMILTAKNYCDMCLKNDPLSCPVIATLPDTPKSDVEWEVLTDEINKRYLATARFKEFLQSLLPPFNEPFNYYIKGVDEK